MIAVKDKIQNIINSMDHGIVSWLIKIFLSLSLIVALFGMYAYSQFQGLNNSEAMEYSQLAHNMAKGMGFSTKCIRPFDMWYIKNHTDREYKIGKSPDISHAPLFPAILSLALRTIKPSFNINLGRHIFEPEKKVVIPLCIFFSLATGVMVFLIGLKLFDSYLALIATLIYFITDAVLAIGISGTPVSLIMFLTTAALYMAIVAISMRSQKHSFIICMIPLTISALLSSLAFLAGYTMIILIPVLGLLIGLGFKQEKGLGLTVFMVVIFIIVFPWLVRNKIISGGFLGSAPYSILNSSVFFEDDSFEKTLDPEINRTKIAQIIKTKLIFDLPRLMNLNLCATGSGLIFCFFLVSFFYRFDKNEVNILRWCILLGIFLLLTVTALQGKKNTANILIIFLPIIILYGTAYFFVIISHMNFFEIGWQTVLVWLFVLLSAIPLITKLAGPVSGFPYPPYFPPFISYVCDFINEDEAICTDIPWATAWYGDKTSILLPKSTDDLNKIINNSRIKIAGLYLTTRTGNKPYISELVEGAYRSWLPVLNGQVPIDFSFIHGIALPPGSRDQLFLTDKIHWKQRKQTNLAEDENSGMKIKISE